MINKIIEIVLRQRIIFENISYLSILRLLSLFIPLLSYPYLIDVLGVDNYGLVIFFQAIAQYLSLFIKFGFNVSATREISIHRKSKEKLSEIVSSVLIIKTLFFLLIILISILLIFFIPLLKVNYVLYFLSLWLCIYDLIFPIWYFQGIEKMKYITIITLLSRFIFLVLIFFLINSEHDFLFIPIINGIGTILVGVFSLYIICVKHRIKLELQPISVIVYYIKGSLAIFTSDILISLYTGANKIILGSFIGPTSVAYYDLAERLVNVLKIPITTIAQAIYPRFALDKNLNFVRKVIKIVLVLSVLSIILSLLLSQFIIDMIGGEEMFPSVNIFRIQSLALIPFTIGYFFGNIILVVFKLNVYYLKIRLYSCGVFIINIGILFLFDQINIVTLSINTVILEFFVGTLAIYYVMRNRVYY